MPSVSGHHYLSQQLVLLRKIVFVVSLSGPLHIHGAFLSRQSRSTAKAQEIQMKLVRLLAIGVLSSTLAPGAFATLLHGTISTSGVGTISATGMTFRIPGATNLNPGAGHFD